MTSKLEDLGCSESVSSHEMVEGMEKYNPDRLKEDIANARKRVSMLYCIFMNSSKIIRGRGSFDC